MKANPSRTYNDPSLPFSDIFRYAHLPSEETVRDEDRTPPPLPVIREGHLEHGYPRGAVPGPPPPRSWSGLFQRHGREDEPEDEDAATLFRKGSVEFSALTDRQRLLNVRRAQKMTQVSVSNLISPFG